MFYRDVNRPITELQFDRKVDRAASGKERPQCRKEILKRGLTPFIERDGYWDFMCCTRPDGKPGRSFLSDGMVRQMAKMIQEGIFTGKGAPSPVKQESWAS